MGADDYRFDDEKMRDFLVYGFCVLQVDYPRSFHERIYEQTQQIMELIGIARPAAVDQMLQLELEISQHVGVEQLAQLLRTEQVA